jgi:RNA polymerase sigma-70 factor (ECF subfamily)
MVEIETPSPSLAFMVDSQPLSDGSGDSADVRAEECVRLLVQHRPAIHAYISTLLPNAADAEEVLQEASIVAWRKFEEFTPGTNFVRWVCSIALREALKFRREHGQGKLLFREELIEQLASEQPDVAELWEERNQALASCFAKLSNRDRELLQASYMSGASAKSAAGRLARPVNSVYKALNRIRERLFECIERTLAAGRRS